jgi:DNA replication protein DnaC
VGLPGTGKSHIALGLTLAAIQAGYTVLYCSAFDLAQDLAEAQATGTRRELVACLCREGATSCTTASSEVGASPYEP